MNRKERRRRLHAAAQNVMVRICTLRLLGLSPRLHHSLVEAWNANHKYISGISRLIPTVALYENPYQARSVSHIRGLQANAILLDEL